MSPLRGFEHPREKARSEEDEATLNLKKPQGADDQEFLWGERKRVVSFFLIKIEIFY